MIASTAVMARIHLLVERDQTPSFTVPLQLALRVLIQLPILPD